MCGKCKNQAKVAPCQLFKKLAGKPLLLIAEFKFKKPLLLAQNLAGKTVTNFKFKNRVLLLAEEFV